MHTESECTYSHIGPSVLPTHRREQYSLFRLCKQRNACDSTYLLTYL